MSEIPPPMRPGRPEPPQDAEFVPPVPAAERVGAPAPGAAGPTAPAASRRNWARLGSIGLVLAFLFGKLKLLIPILQFAKFGTLFSMVIAMWAYAQLWGAPFAIGFVLLIFVHELGHALVLRQQGIPAGAPVFIPFLGAVIAMKGMPRNAWVEALVGIGGPVLGSLGALVCLIIGTVTREPFWLALASTGFFLNLFNLLPISPLDGGRIVGVISKWLWVVGFVIGTAIFLVTFHPILLLILVVGLFSARRTAKGPHPTYFDVQPTQRVVMGLAYFGLAGALALAMWATDQELARLMS
jgi:Zn-dependent protease